MRPVIVLARSYAEAHAWSKTERLLPAQWKHLRTPDQIRGCQPGALRVVRVNGAMVHPSIEGALDHRGMTVEAVSA